VSEQSLFDGPLAIANSCYTAPEDPLGRKLEFMDEREGEPPPLVQAMHAEFRSKVLGEHFPCIGAHAALNDELYRFGFYAELGSLASTAGLGRDMERYVRDLPTLGPFATFIAVFDGPQPDSEEHFETLLWQQLQLLHDHDRHPWDKHYSSDPRHPSFTYSFAGLGSFVVGFHPRSSRRSRQFVKPTLVFNPEYQVDRLHTEGRFLHWRTVIRRRDVALQGSVNPSLPADAGETLSGAPAYSGRVNDRATWVCPLRVRPELANPLPTPRA
jgi:FPC/CPF motif-containing protein YcgG